MWNSMTWFEELTGCPDESIETVRQNLKVIDGRLHSACNDSHWQVGTLAVTSLKELRTLARQHASQPKSISVQEVVANVQLLHQEPANANALFQVASQFNLLEMTSPGVTPEAGIGSYEMDLTQGPACSIAAGAGTIYRNYFVPLDGQIGQSADKQIDCLADLGKQLGNEAETLWRMTNGYALPQSGGLQAINRALEDSSDEQRDQLKQLLKIGLQWQTEVTIGSDPAAASPSTPHLVSQAFCSAMPVAYTRWPLDQWEPLARLILEAAYEATLCAGIFNAATNGSSRLFLTMLGGGAFGNDPDWITDALQQSLSTYDDCGLEIFIVSYGASNPAVRRIAQQFA